METIRLRAELANGRVMVGAVKGNGGFLGNGSLHAGQAAAQGAALSRILAASRIAAKGRPTGILEPVSGHVVMCPNPTVSQDDAVVWVPLQGTRWSVYDGEPPHRSPDFARHERHTAGAVLRAELEIESILGEALKCST